MTQYDRPRIQVLVGGRDLTDRCDSITFSATDTGGYEIATFGLPSADRPQKGDPIIMRQGLDVCWYGRGAEISDHSQHDRATKTSGGEGGVALLRDNPMQMVYVDRDLTQWSDPSVSRQIALNLANDSLGSSTAASDPTAGLPALVQEIDDSWVSPFIPNVEAWYDAGVGNLIALVYGNLLSAVGSGWFAQAYFASDDIATASQSTGNIANAGEFSLQAGPPERYVVANWLNTGTPGGVPGAQFLAFWRNLTAYGNHGLALRGPNPPGLYPSDIARHVLSQASGITPGTIIDAIGYIAPHVTYPTPTGMDQIIDDMATLMGWPWGVWEPTTILGSQPRLDFGPPPTDATAIVSKAECDELDITSRLGDLYSTAEVTFSDAAGIAGMSVVSLPNPQLNEAGIQGRTLILDMGLATPASATTFGLFALALSQVSSRAAGQVTLPTSVRLPGGGSKPAHLVKPGIDRLRVTDLVDGGPMFNIGTARRDTFRISRTETTVGRDGTPSTRAEIDSGTNLLETLQARLALSAGVVGAGASGG